MSTNEEKNTFEVLCGVVCRSECGVFSLVLSSFVSSPLARCTGDGLGRR